MQFKYRQQTEHFLCSINLLVRFERGRAYSSQGKSTLPSPLLVAAMLKIVSHATIFFLSHYNSPLQEMAVYI